MKGRWCLRSYRLNSKFKFVRHFNRKHHKLFSFFFFFTSSSPPIPLWIGGWEVIRIVMMMWIKTKITCTVEARVCSSPRISQYFYSLDFEHETYNLYVSLSVLHLECNVWPYSLKGMLHAWYYSTQSKSCLKDMWWGQAWIIQRDSRARTKFLNV